MRLRTLVCVVAALPLIAACNEGQGDAARLEPVPTAVSCADAPQLRQRAAEDRRASEARQSDQEKPAAG